MNTAKRTKLERAGWTVGSASEFLELSEAEEAIINIKLALAKDLKERRQKHKLTQEHLAKRIGSSQSRIAKMETADSTVSIDLFVKSLTSLGATKKEIGKALL